MKFSQSVYPAWGCVYSSEFLWGLIWISLPSYRCIAKDQSLMVLLETLKIIAPNCALLCCMYHDNGTEFFRKRHNMQACCLDALASDYLTKIRNQRGRALHDWDGSPVEIIVASSMLRIYVYFIVWHCVNRHFRMSFNMWRLYFECSIIACFSGM